MKKNIIIVLSVTLLFAVGGLVYVLNTRIAPSQIPHVTIEPISTTTVPLVINNTNTESTETELLSIDTSPEAIAGWETCRNEEYGYEFKYPKGWYVYKVFVGSETVYHKEISMCIGSHITLSQKVITSPKQSPPAISVRLFVNNWNGRLEEYLETLNTELFPVVVIKKDTINEIEILYYIRQDLLQVLFLNKGNIFNLNVGTQNLILQPEFLNAVISTFKFH